MLKYTYVHCIAKSQPNFMYTQLALRRFWYSIDAELLLWQHILTHNQLQTVVDKVQISKCLCKLHSICVQGLYEPFACI